MDLGLHGKRALVSGASAGIGFSVAETLAAEGADVAIVSRDEARIGFTDTERLRELADSAAGRGARRATRSTPDGERGFPGASWGAPRKSLLRWRFCAPSRPPS